MGEHHILVANYSNDGYSKAKPASGRKGPYQYDYGQVLQLEGFIDLPQTFETHFSVGNNKSVTMIGADGLVEVPDQCFTQYGTVTAWLYLHDTVGDGETRYVIEISVKRRAEITNQEPTPVQQDTITQAIAALNAGVEAAEQAADKAAEDAAEAASDVLNGKADKRDTVLDTTLSRGRKDGTTAGPGSIAFGYSVEASGFYSSAFGTQTKATNNSSHAEGDSTEANGERSHAEGASTKAIGNASHAEGTDSAAIGSAAHAENSGYALGLSSHAEGSRLASGRYSHAEGSMTRSNGVRLYATAGENTCTVDPVLSTLKIGAFLVIDQFYGKVIEIDQENKRITIDTPFDKDYGNARYSIFQTSSSGNYSHAEGYNTDASNTCAHAEGYQTNAAGSYSHTEGMNTEASGSASHAEGANTQATAQYSHAEGAEATASGSISHAEGYQTTAAGSYSHAEGSLSSTSGYVSHAEGLDTKAEGHYSHSQGIRTIANGYGMTAIGKFNMPDTLYPDWTAGTAYVAGDKVNRNGVGYECTVPNSDTEFDANHWVNVLFTSDEKTAFAIGNGTGVNTRSNAMRVDYSGNMEVAGKVSSGTAADHPAPTAANDLTPKDYVDGRVDDIGTATMISGNKYRIAI